MEEHAARYVRYIFGRRTAGDTLREIADVLNARNLASPQGRRWHASTVHEVLGNEAIYRGGTRGATADTLASDSVDALCGLFSASAPVTGFGLPGRVCRLGAPTAKIQGIDTRAMLQAPARSSRYLRRPPCAAFVDTR